LMLAALQDFKKTFLKMVDDATSKNNQVNEAIVLGKMSALKMIATCPERINEKFGKEVYDGPAGGGKITDILTLAFEKLAAGEKIVLLSDFIGTQKLLEEKLKDYNPIRFLTTWDTDEREEAFDKFANDPTAKAFIAGTRAINAGVDLSPANSVFCCDLLWSPALQMQAWSRILAPRKEERNCDIFLFSSKHSIDENIYETFYSKMVAAEQAFDRRIVARKSQTLDIKFFAQRVLEDEALLRLDLGFTDDSEVVISNIDMEVVGEWREA
jgi:SNF2 family DNA or RNA helicase